MEIWNVKRQRLKRNSNRQITLSWWAVLRHTNSFGCGEGEIMANGSITITVESVLTSDDRSDIEYARLEV